MINGHPFQFGILSLILFMCILDSMILECIDDIGVYLADQILLIMQGDKVLQIV